MEENNENIFETALVEIGGITDPARIETFMTAYRSGKVTERTVTIFLELKDVAISPAEKLLLLLASIEKKIKESYIEDLINWNDIAEIKDTLRYYITNRRAEINFKKEPKIDFFKQPAKPVQKSRISANKPAVATASKDVGKEILKTLGFAEETINIVIEARSEGRISNDDLKFIQQTIEDPKIPIGLDEMVFIFEVFKNRTSTMEETLGLIMQGVTDGTLPIDDVFTLVDCIINNKIEDVFTIIYEMDNESRRKKLAELAGI